MSCKAAKRTDEYHGWECEVTGGACVFYFPDSKACAEQYGEGPDAYLDRKCENCEDYTTKDNQRFCQLTHENIDDEVICCGGFKKKDGEA